MPFGYLGAAGGLGGGGPIGNTVNGAYNQGGPGAGRAITANAGAVEINASGANALKLDGYLTLQEISTPASLANKGLAYSQDDGGDTELFYRDDKGRSTQLTKDGQIGPHATQHKSGGYYSIKLDELAAPTDVTTLNSTVAAHGLLPKLSGSPGDALRGDGTWGVVSSDGYNVKISATDTTPDYLQYRSSFDRIFYDYTLPGEPSFYIHAPSRIDPFAAPDSQDTLMALVPVGHLHPEKSQDMDALVNKARSSMFRRLSEIGVTDLEDNIKFEIVYSPETWQDLYNLTHGAAFGLSLDFW